MPFFSSDVAESFSTSPLTLRNQFSRWKKQGLLAELKRGLYVLGQGERQTPLNFCDRKGYFKNLAFVGGTALRTIYDIE